MNKKIEISPSAVTAASSLTLIGGYAERSESVADRVNKWFIEPLRKMNGPQGFLVLLVIFPLYEKHLRIRHGMKDRFKKGDPIFRVVGRHLKLSSDDAFEFWRHFRNGLLHHALPKVSPKFEYGIRTNGPPVKRIDNRFWINPFALRDRLLDEIEPDTRTWKADDVPLAKTYDLIAF